MKCVKLTSSAPGQQSHHIFIYDHQMLVFGGLYSKTLYSFNLTTKEWKIVETSGEPPPPSRGSATARTGNDMYVQGGIDNTYTYCRNLYVLNFDRMKWTRLIEIGEPGLRWYHSAVIYNQSFIVFGGDGYFNGPTMYNDVVKFDLNTHTWKRLIVNSGVPPKKRKDHIAVLYDHNMFIYGGVSEDQRLNDFHVFDLLTHQWREIDVIGCAPSYRSGMKSVVYGDKMYMFGGASTFQEVNLQMHSNDLFEFCFTRHRWEWKALTGDIPKHRSFHAMCVSEKEGEIFVYGGESANVQRLKDVYKIVLERRVDSGLLERVKKNHFVDVNFLVSQ